MSGTVFAVAAFTVQADLVPLPRRAAEIVPRPRRSTSTSAAPVLVADETAGIVA
ncbi:MAG TPA: hypothetical protein VF933_38195 [Streptosporangiaceae bacterium]